MKFKIRRSSQEDLTNIFDLHTRCFASTDCWYMSAIKPYLNNGIVIVHTDTDTNKLVGVLLQGSIKPCNRKFDSTEINESLNATDYKEDVFVPKGISVMIRVFLSCWPIRARDLILPPLRPSL